MMDDFELTYELQKMAAESPDKVEVSIDENGDIELNVRVFIELLRKAWK